MLPWEAAVASILRTPASRGDKAAALFSLLRQLPTEAWPSVTEQALAWLPDSEFERQAGPMLADPETHGLVASVLFADLMQRPQSVSLPLLLAVARQAAHPYATSARDNLALLLGQNRGEDWVGWQRAIDAKLSAGALPR